MSAQQAEKKISVYVGLGVIAVITIADLVITGAVDSTKEISLGLIAFIGLRQAAKSLLNK